jgi:predicted nucleic acid-binding protein
MFVLDTSILSAMMKLESEPEVAKWMEGQDEALLFTTTISYAEILAGLAVMANGRRRRALEDAAGVMFEEFDVRVLPFDHNAAANYAELFAVRKRAGRPAATFDLMIGAITHCHDAGVVTRDIGGFEECGLRLINPWGAA